MNPDHPPGTSPTDANSPWTMRPPRKRLYEVTVTIRVEADDPDDALGVLDEGDVINLIRIEEMVEER